LAKAQIQEKTLDFDGAMASYRQLISADDQNAAALNNLAFLLAMRGENPSEAVAFAQRAMARTGPVPAVIDTYAVALISSGKPGQAVELLKSIAADDGLPASHFHQAWAYFKSGDDQAASNAMREAGKRGLRLEALHPLEVPVYEQLRSRGIRLAE
jgi:predicted Zn-dependent protease